MRNYFALACACYAAALCLRHLGEGKHILAVMDGLGIIAGIVGFISTRLR